MKDTSSQDTAQQEFVELTPGEICRINGAAETAVVVMGVIYPEVDNEPPH